MEWLLGIVIFLGCLFVLRFVVLLVVAVCMLAVRGE